MVESALHTHRYGDLDDALLTFGRMAAIYCQVIRRIELSKRETVGAYIAEFTYTLSEVL